MGISFFAGEAEEGRLDEVLRDAWNGTLKPLYNYMDDLPSHRRASRRRSCRRKHVQRTSGSHVELRSRPRLPVPVLVLHHHQRAGPQEPLPHAPTISKQIIRENYAQGIKRFFITDDNFARNQRLGSALRPADRAARTSEGIEDRLHHPGRHALPPHPELHREGARGRRAAASSSGWRTSIPDNLIAAKKRQNKITEYREMLQKWRDHGAITYAGYILGFPGDTQGIDPARHRDHQARTAARHPRVLLPDAAARLRGPQGSVGKGVWMDPDLNKYDLNHRVAHHPKMRDAEWEEAYRAAWAAYYTPEHIRTILRRAAACKLGRPGTTLSTILWFYLMILFEGVHPLEGGAFRLKFRRDRRHGHAAREPVRLLSALRRRDARQGCGATGRSTGNARRSSTRCWRRPIAGPTATSRSRRRKADEFEALDLYHATSGGEAALARKHRDDAIRDGAPPVAARPAAAQCPARPAELAQIPFRWNRHSHRSSPRKRGPRATSTERAILGSRLRGNERGWSCVNSKSVKPPSGSSETRPCGRAPCRMFSVELA